MPVLEIPLVRLTRLELPSICFVTGSTDIVWETLTFGANRRFSKTITLDLPLARGLREKVERTMAILMWSLNVPTIALAFATIFLGDLIHPLLLWNAIILWLAMTQEISIRIVQRRWVDLDRFDGTTAHVKIPSEEAARAVQERLSAPPMSPPEGTRCLTHDAEASRACGRCGNFVCASCGRDRFGLCTPCSTAVSDLDLPRARRLHRLDLGQAGVLEIFCLLPGFVTAMILASLIAVRRFRAASERPELGARWVPLLFFVPPLFGLVATVGFFLSRGFI